MTFVQILLVEAFFGAHSGARMFLKLRLIDLCIFTSCFFHVILGVVKIRKVAKYWIQSANALHGARQKKLRKATSIKKWFGNEIKKSREFKSNLSTFSACNFQLEIFDYHYPNNHNSKNSFFVLLRKFELLPRVFVLFL